MWDAQPEPLENGRIIRYTIAAASRRISYQDVIELWMQDAAFRTYFSSLLADARFPAFFWETPPVTQTNLSRDFEFVLVDSPALANVTDEPGVFQEHFAQAPGEYVVTFRNLGKDALLVAPCPICNEPAYAHLAAFVRLGPTEQQQTFWQRVGTAMHRQVRAQPVWLSTSGLGVYWLHARLDSYPKYYTYPPYRQPGYPT